MSIIVRNCPSPTGLLHIGTLRTMLYNYIFAKQNNGQIVFRSEDTDKNRSTLEFEENILSGAKKLGLIDDNTEVIRQSERTEIYKKYIQQLLEEGKAYYCFMTPDELEKVKKEQRENKQPQRYPWTFRDFPYDEAVKKVKNGERAVIRLKVPKQEEIIFNDLIRWKIKTNTKDLDDFVIAKNITTPLYNFCVVIDDHEMNVSHVLRWEDHIPNTPKQVLVYKSLGWNIPEHAHFPLILNADKSKLSKRKNKVSVDDYLSEGYLAESLINFLALLGWNSGTEQELFTLDDLIEKFSLDRVHKGGAVFDVKKLEWINGQYIKNMEVDDFILRLNPFLEKLDFNDKIKEKGQVYLKSVIKVSQLKLKKLSDIWENIEFFYIKKEAGKDLICNEKMKVTSEIAKQAIEATIEIFENLLEFTEEKIKEKLVEKIQELGWKNWQMLWPLRAALTGEQFSPGAFEVAVIFGKEESIKRLKESMKVL